MNDTELEGLYPIGISGLYSDLDARSKVQVLSERYSLPKYYSPYQFNTLYPKEHGVEIYISKCKSRLLSHVIH